MVASLVADGEQTELGQARVGVEDQAVRGGGERFEVVPHGEAFLEVAAAVFDGGMTQSGIGGEQFEVFARAGEDDFGFREGLFGGGEQDAGDRDVRAEGDAGEHEYTLRLPRYRTGTADTIVTRHQSGGVLTGNSLRKQVRVDIAQGGFEAVSKALYEDSKQRFGTGLFEQRVGKALGRVAGDAAVQQKLREELTRSTCQSESPASVWWRRAPWHGR